MKLTFPRSWLNASAKISALAATALPMERTDGEESQQRTSAMLAEVDSTAAPERRVESSLFETPRYSINRIIFNVPAEWDNASVALFQDLATREALETITAEELEELNQLTALRRETLASSPRPEEVLAELSQWRSSLKVIQALEEYAAAISRTKRVITNRS